MEVEISSHTFDRSRNGPAAVVANDSHVVLLAERGTNYGRVPVSLITDCATRPSGARNANLLSTLDEMNVEQDLELA